jgi:hypothetical protein
VSTARDTLTSIEEFLRESRHHNRGNPGSGVFYMVRPEAI